MKVTFATSCWEKDWRLILLDPEYLKKKQIENHCFPFAEHLLIINNVVDLPLVLKAARETAIFSRIEVASEAVLPFFHLKRSDFTEWQYYNALGPLNAIYHCQTEYLLYLTGDVRLDRPVDWVAKAICFMEKRPIVKVANLTWNENYREARRESYRRTWNFFVSKNGFSDQMFLVKRADFRAPIYQEIRPDSSHYPRGDVFEKRVLAT